MHLCILHNYCGQRVTGHDVKVYRTIISQISNRSWKPYTTIFGVHHPRQLTRTTETPSRIARRPATRGTYMIPHSAIIAQLSPTIAKAQQQYWQTIVRLHLQSIKPIDIPTPSMPPSYVSCTARCWLLLTYRSDIHIMTCLHYATQTTLMSSPILLVQRRKRRKLRPPKSAVYVNGSNITSVIRAPGPHEPSFLCLLGRRSSELNITTADDRPHNFTIKQHLCNSDRSTITASEPCTRSPAGSLTTSSRP